MIVEVKDAIKENAKQIEDIKQTLEFICVDIKAVRVRVDHLKAQLTKFQETRGTQEKRLSCLESYSHRWNLKLYGLEEKEKEDIRKEAIHIFQAVLQEAKDKLPDVVDTVHCLGPKKTNNTHPRGIILQFTSRIYRDAVWHSAKSSSFLKNNNLRLAEDLSTEDREEWYCGLL